MEVLGGELFYFTRLCYLQYSAVHNDGYLKKKTVLRKFKFSNSIQLENQYFVSGKLYFYFWHTRKVGGGGGVIEGMNSYVSLQH